MEHAWSRPTLAVHIQSQLYLRQDGAITNFERRLDAPHVRLAIEAIERPGNCAEDGERVCSTDPLALPGRDQEARLFAAVRERGA